jgi:hypothetical protein
MNKNYYKWKTIESRCPLNTNNELAINITRRGIMESSST